MAAGRTPLPSSTRRFASRRRRRAISIRPRLHHGKRGDSEPPFVLAVLPLVVVIVMNFLMSLVVLPRLDFSFLAEEAWGGTTIGAVAGVWSVVVALAAGTLTVVIINYRRLPALRESLDAGANSSVLPILTVASLVGFGAVVAALPAFAAVRDAVLSIQGGPLVSLTVAMNVLAGLTGSASGGMAIALNALGDTFMRLAAEHGIDPALMHRVTTISAGTLDALPHNGTVLTVASDQRTDSPRKLFRHGDDRDRQRDHRTCGRPCAGFGVWIVLIDSRCACGTALRLVRQPPISPRDKYRASPS